MNDDQRFGDTDHEALAPDDILARAIQQLPDAGPARDVWPSVSAQIMARPRRQVAVTWRTLAVAASLLMAITSGATWLFARQPAIAARTESIVQAENEPMGMGDGRVQQANFADAQYDAAVSDLERILHDDRIRLDPRTVIVIERNLQAIDDAIGQARRALDADPANPYLNSHLADARRRKLNLLRRATELASTGGD